jgi:hypothetical protein
MEAPKLIEMYCTMQVCVHVLHIMCVYPAHVLLDVLLS